VTGRALGKRRNGEDSLREGFQVPALPCGASCVGLVSVHGCCSNNKYNGEDSLREGFQVPALPCGLFTSCWFCCWMMGEQGVGEKAV